MDETKLHEGHRRRLYETYCRAGLDGYSDVNVLELLLTFAIPRRDTNELAHRLLAQFGSLHAVFDAPMEQLLRVEGITPRAAMLLHMQSGLRRRYEESKQQYRQRCLTTRDCAQVLLQKLAGIRDEQTWILSLDSKCRLLDVRKLSDGTATNSELPVRRIVEIALTIGAASVVIGHNHNSGIVFPSKDDVLATARLRDALEALDLPLADHVIIADREYYSMRDNGLL